MSRVLQSIARHALERSGACALSGHGRSWTYASLNAEVGSVAGAINTALSAADADAPIAIALDNCPEWAIADLAAIQLNRPVLPIPPFFTDEQRNHALNISGACAIIRPAKAGESSLISSKATGGIAITRIPASRRALPFGTAKITFTSGSTAAPKGVCLSQQQMEDVAVSIVDAIGSDSAGRHFATLPLGVLLENVAGLYSTLIAGGEQYLPSLRDIGFATPFAPDFRRLEQAIEESKASSLILVPELLRGLLACWAEIGRAPEHLKFVAVGGAKVSPDLLRLAENLGAPVYEGYGLTECGSVVALNTPHANKAGSVGQPLAHARVSIDDQGEIVVGPSPFLGYVGEPQKEPVLTGDLGALDKDGYLYVTGRRSNLIITAHGRNISPEWVESELCAQPEISCAIVAGEAQANLCAIVSPTRSVMTEAQIKNAIDKANAKLPEYARVARFRLAAPFNQQNGLLTGNGRPRRTAILAAYRDFVEQCAG